MADDDLDILAWTMLGEAGGQGQQGMSDVAHVVLNRLNAGGYGGSIQDVALAPKQFSTWNSGSGGNDPKGKYPKSSDAFQRARQIAEQVIAGQIPGPPGRPLDYNASNISPYWADSKSQNGTYTRNGHTFYPSVPVPPGELPEVGTLQDTVPSRRVTPVTPSPQMNAMRGAGEQRTNYGQGPDGVGLMPSMQGVERFANGGKYTPANYGVPQRSSAEINSTIAELSRPKPRTGLGDQLGMSPIQGGTQQAPLFDAGFDERSGAMRLMPEALDTQGVFTARSPSPPRLLPPIPPSTLGQPPATRTVQSVPVTPRPPTPGQTYAGQDRSPPPALPSPILARPGVTRTASLAGDVALPPGVRPQVPSTAPPVVQTEAQRLAALYANGGPTRPFVQMPNQQQVADATGFRVPQGAQFTYDPTASQPTTRLPSILPPSPTPVLPPTPTRYRPIPFDRPSFMPQMVATPPMPPSRPQRSVPLMRPVQQMPARAPLRITVNGGNVQQAPVAPRMSPQQAYEAANQAAAQRARDRSGNSTERSDYFKMATGG